MTLSVSPSGTRALRTLCRPTLSRAEMGLLLGMAALLVLAWFGPAQADGYHDGLEATFNFLVEYPRAAREREEIRSPVRIYPYKAHLIVYELGPNDNVLILRVRHAREDWLSEMDEA